MNLLKNYMESFVDDLLPAVLEEYDNVCSCEKCTADMKAIALNNLRPLYVASEKGSLYVKVNEFETQFRSDVIKELMRAIEIVSKNVRHDIIDF